MGEGIHSRAKRLEALSLHTFELLPSSKAEKAIEATISRISPPHLYIPLQRVGRSAPITETRTMGEIRADIERLIDEVSTARDYNGLLPLVKLLNEFEKRPAEKEALIAYNFAMSCEEEAPVTSGSTCIGRSRELTSLLRARGYDARVAYERMGPLEPFQHAAVAVCCTDGILLIDPLNPKVSRIEEIAVDSSKKLASGIDVKIETIDEESGCISISKSKGVTKEGSFEIYDIENGDAVVMGKYLFRRHIYPIVTYRDDVAYKVIKVDPTTKEVTLQEGSGKSTKVIAKIPFSEITAKPDTFEETLESFMSDDFLTPVPVAKDLLHSLCRNHERIDRLYAQIHAPYRVKP